MFGRFNNTYSIENDCGSCVQMKETNVQIPVENGETVLNGRFAQGENGRSVVICHPHPLYGGTMDNNVVLLLAKLYQSLGWTTLRFNFRSVGGGGRPFDGDCDARDLIDVTAYLKARTTGFVDLAGYSYGAWVVLKAIRVGLATDTLCLVAPPINLFNYQGLRIPDVPTFIAVGNTDEFCSVKTLKSWLAEQPERQLMPTIDIIPYCDHFYWEFEDRLAFTVAGFLKKTAKVNFSIADSLEKLRFLK